MPYHQWLVLGGRYRDTEYHMCCEQLVKLKEKNMLATGFIALILQPLNTAIYVSLFAFNVI